MPMCILVDGSSYLFRAFHALPPLTTATGQHTGAIYGVINMLRKLIQDEKPDHLAVIFDTKSKNFRHIKYPAYKANRPPMADELSSQIAPLHALIQAMGLPLIAIEGWEADDVIATLAHKATDAGYKVLISTSDKDLAQLVNEDITCVNTMTGSRLDQKGVWEKFGVHPNQIVDYLTLIGDSVDNIPGVPKVGPKTAAKWLNQYETLENLVAHAHEITGKIGENLRGHLPQFSWIKPLVGVERNAPLGLTVEALSLVPENKEALRKYYTDLEFKTWLKGIEAEVVPAPEVERHYESLLTQDDLDRWLVKLKEAKAFCIEPETAPLSSLKAQQLIGIAFAIKPGEAAYLALGHHYLGAPSQLNINEVLLRLKPLLEDSHKGKIGLNIKFTYHIFAQLNIKIAGLLEDPQLASYVINSIEKNDIVNLARKNLHSEALSFESIVGKGAKQKSFAETDITLATRYAAQKADLTLQLSEHFKRVWSVQPRLEIIYREIELPLSEVLWSMERTGIEINAEELNRQALEVGSSIEQLERQAHALAGRSFNLSSPKQLQEILYEEKKLPILEKTPSGAPSTREEILQELADKDPLPRVIVEHRMLSKLKSTYLDKLPLEINAQTGRVHTTYQQATTVTGRLSSTEPNLQNIPIRNTLGRRIRQAFVAPKGHVLMAADYSQIELRIMAHLSGDAQLQRAFKENQDIHQFTASQVLGLPLEAVTSDQRRNAKATNFGLIYGMSEFGLSKQLKISREEARIYMTGYFERYPGVKLYMENTRLKAAEQGFIETLEGRRLYLPDIKARQVMKRRAAERMAINAPMQGTAADIIKRAMINIQLKIANNPSIKLLMQVHDELVFEVEEQEIEKATILIKTAMEGAATLSVPLVVDIGIGKNWDEAH